MRLLRTDCDELTIVTFNNERTLPEYGILSHTWLRDEDEIAFNELANLDAAKSKAGWTKLDFAMRQAYSDGLHYVWVDTCCIDKSSSAELAEAINSMYRWYSRAQVCYVYLEDFSCPKNQNECSNASEVDDNVVGDAYSTVTDEVSDIVPREREGVADSTSQKQDIERGNAHATVSPPESEYEMSTLTGPGSVTANAESLVPQTDLSGLGRSKWFSRGWTLQELLAPERVQFFSSECNSLGSLASLTKIVSDTTGIHVEALSRVRPIASFSVAQRMCWASQRETTRVEDQAYCLLGIFNVNMPIMYGEGEGAFLRLQEAILRAYSDHTIFAWSERPDCWAVDGFLEVPHRKTSSSLLANSAYAFRNSGSLVPVNTDRPHRAYEVISGTIQFEVPAMKSSLEDLDTMIAVLNCRNENDCTKEVCINLYSTGSVNVYGVQGESMRPRIEMKDIYAMSSICEIRTINILRYDDRVRIKQHRTTALTILCRMDVRGTDSKFYLIGHQRSRGVSWSSSTKCFNLTSKRLAKPVANVIRSTPDASLTTEYGSPGFTAGGDEILGQVEIWRAGTMYGQLNFIRGTAGQSVSFDPDTPSYHEWRGRLLRTVVPASMTWFQGVSMFATIEKRQLLHENIDVIQIQVAGNWLAIRLGLRHSVRVFIQWLIELDIPGGWTLSFQRTVLPGCLLFLLTVAVPILATSIVRGGGGIDESQTVALEVGLPLALLSTVVAALKKERIIPSTTYHGWGHLRMILFTLLVFTNIVQAILCGVYGHLVSRHRAMFEQYEQLADLRRLGVYEDARRMAITWSVLSALFAIILASYRPLSRLKILPSIGGKTGLLHLILSLIIIVPFASIAHRSLSVLKPWSKSDCNSVTKLGGAATFYATIANATGDEFNAICESFAFEGRLLLSILSLGIWLWLVDIMTATVTGWLIFRLNMKMYRKWLIW